MNTTAMKNLWLLAALLLTPALWAGDKTVRERVNGRAFPSVFQAWNKAEVKGEDELKTLARHDIFWHNPDNFGMVWNRSPQGLADGFTEESIKAGLEKRRQLLALNPNMLLLAEVRFHDAWKAYLPEGHKWWKRDEKGEIEKGWAEGDYLMLDFHNPEFREHVARQAKAAVASGVFDGIFLDWWRDDADRLELIKTIRAAIGEETLIMGNANDMTTPLTGGYLNGYFMECWKSEKPSEWETIAETLLWAEQHLREPRINCLETWYHQSRGDLGLCRAVTTLVLTHSDGYALFSDPNKLPSPDHLHDWYPFWDRHLGRPLAIGMRRADGTADREYEHGTAVYNPLGNKPVRVVFPDVRRSLATGVEAREHELQPADGDLYLRTTPLQTRLYPAPAQGGDALAAPVAEAAAPNPGAGEEMIVNADFAQGAEHWVFWQADGVEASFRLTDEGPENGKAALVEVKKAADAWRVIFSHTPLKVAAGARYRLTFWAKANAPLPVFASVQQEHPPWEKISKAFSPVLSGEWKKYEVELKTDTDDDKARLQFELGANAGSFSFARVSMARL